MKIRKLSEKEVSKFFLFFSEVLRDGFPEYSKELIDYLLDKDCSLSFFKNKVKEKEWTVWTAEDDQRIIGFLVAEKLYGGVSYCPWVGVRKEMRGKKEVGRKLIEVWESEIKKLGGHRLMLLTQAKENEIFFKKCGFNQEGFERVSWFGLDCWLFGKVIGEPKPEVFLK